MVTETIKWEVGQFSIQIRKRICERESEHYVWIKKIPGHPSHFSGRDVIRMKKHCELSKFFDSYKEANDYLIKRLEKKIEFEKRKIAELEKELLEVKARKDPE